MTTGPVSAETAGRTLPKTCFVVMPFGKKPRIGGEGTHDFDKIYRVVIKRAVERAGMKCIRADEHSGSRLIHTDMFKDLRDQPLVIADLSLQNPNVFYELGVRHVMSSTGTVLMCEAGSMPLPFDINLSRVIPYEYDGKNLDWEEAEKLVGLLSVALLESATGKPDSPVHALLERVTSENPDDRIAWGESDSGFQADESLDRYLELVSSTWRSGDRTLPELVEEHRDSIFGTRALAMYLRSEDELPVEPARDVAEQLSDFGEFELAADVYARITQHPDVTPKDLTRYAYCYSESHPNLAGTDRALALVAEASALVEAKYAGDRNSPGAAGARAHCVRREAGLRQWRWQQSGSPEDLDVAIDAHGEAIELLTAARREGLVGLPSLLAQSHLKRLLLLRIRSEDEALHDPMDDVRAVLGIKGQPADEPKHLSYLRWFQAIALADTGAKERVRQSALEAFAKDADLMHRGPQYAEIGRRQYVQLRRFLEQYSRWFRHPELIGLIGQTLDARR